MIDESDEVVEEDLDPILRYSLQTAAQNERYVQLLREEVVLLIPAETIYDVGLRNGVEVEIVRVNDGVLRAMLRLRSMTKRTELTMPQSLDEWSDGLRDADELCCSLRYRVLKEGI